MRLRFRASGDGHGHGQGDLQRQTGARGNRHVLSQDRAVGLAYVDDGILCTEFYPDDEGDPWVFHADELQRTLDTAAAMLIDDEGDEAEPPAGPDPVDVLALEFDPLAVRRGPEDEGFYPLGVAARIIARCGDLGLAAVLVEGLTLHADRVEPVPGCTADLGDAHAGEPWALFQAGCNTQARAVIERWPQRADFAVALEVQDRSGDQYVL